MTSKLKLKLNIKVLKNHYTRDKFQISPKSEILVQVKIQTQTQVKTKL